ncbi:hypothetical protein K470DRAFT_42765 [Piedraia hortae CBS 480.64]|uniref:Uncharacterized protein n=1 Tax=Piedraia hortae CBS 480.64 TaxID=1314780 RepID=A0A6A7C1F6_9PEZI|nr:hypothetical protein K470DRAFT_42765 [Piedraia hortae CBS 480.64]
MAPKTTALILAHFHPRVGYKLTFSRSDPTLSLSLAEIEYKLFPSGLHAVPSDVIYFSHADQIGVAVFQQRKSGASQRGAEFSSLGVLIPRTAGGDLWKYIPKLRELVDGEEEELEGFWGTCTLKDSLEDPTPEAENPRKRFGALVRLLGERVFMLLRFVMQGKRVLILDGPPVKRGGEVCFLLGSLAGTGRCLFSVGVRDIPLLEGEGGYVATTTDGILAEKRGLFDYLVEVIGENRVRVKGRDGREVKVGKRDWEKWSMLKGEGGILGESSDKIEGHFRDLRETFLRKLERMVEDRYSDEDTPRVVVIGADQIRALGLDPSAEMDREFVVDMVRIHLGKNGVVQSGRRRSRKVRVCGVVLGISLSVIAILIYVNYC